MPSQRLKGLTAWISGATSGIGEATARLFAAEGANVAVTGLSGSDAELLAKEISSAGGTAWGGQCDVTVDRQIRESIAETLARFGSLNILVNNAGAVLVKRLHECTDEEWDRINAVNLRSMFYSVRAAIPHLRRNARSWIVNVGSVSGFVGQAATPIYTTTKHAVLGLTRSIALDYAADGIRCNCVCPGITDTWMLRQHLEDSEDPEGQLQNRLRRVPLGAILQPEEVARAILFLSCEDSSGITGTALTIDGGYTAAAEWDAQPRPRNQS